MHRFGPAPSLQTFLLQASLGGLAVLATTKELGPEVRSTYDTMRLVFQQAPLLREHLARYFVTEVDLKIVAVEQEGRDRHDVLPDGIGMPPDGQGKRWSVAQLMKHGRQHATNLGESNADPARCIAAGLFVAASRDPLDPGALTEEKARVLVRIALFDLGPDVPAPDADTREGVTESFLAALEQHLPDDTETFNRFFFEGRDALIRRLAKQKRYGGPYPRELVRKVLLDLVYDAYQSVGQCVGAQMRAFLRALPTPLDESESAWFKALYLGQPELGGLPLVMLRDRFTFLREAVLAVMNDPNEGRHLGVLLRLIHYYGEMVSLRREVDRSYKRRSQHRNTKGQVARTDSLIDDAIVAGAEPPALEFQRIAERLRQRRAITCECGLAGLWKAALHGERPGEESVEISLTCQACGAARTIETTREEIRSVACPSDRAMGPQEE
jgi:hypothetical protein